MAADDRVIATEMRSFDALRTLAPEWRALCARAHSCTPFQYPEWILPWWSHFGAVDGSDLRVLALRHAGSSALVGLAPFHCRHDPDGATRLALLGTGNTDYVDAIVAPGFEGAALRMFAGYLHDIRDSWDECDLHPLSSTTLLRQLPARGGLRIAETQSDVFPVLELRANGEGLAERVPHGVLAKLRHARRRLQREGGFDVEHADAQSAPELFEIFCALHAARWRDRGEPGVLANERSRHFHAEVVAGMAAEDMLRLNVLRVRGQPAGACYGFARGSTLYLYLGGFDPAFERDSAGSLAILDAIEHAIERGQRRFDFLRGAEAYKYRWGAVEQPGYRVRIVRERGVISEKNVA